MLAGLTQRPPQPRMATPAAAPSDKATLAFTSRLGEHCWREFCTARDNRRDITDRMLEDLRMRRCIYSTEDEQIIAIEGGSRIYLPLVATKCQLALAMLSAIYLNGERPFEGKPSPVPELPAEVAMAIRQEAEAQFQQFVANGVIRDPLELADQLKAEVIAQAREWAQAQAEFDTSTVDDVLVEGGFYRALPTFLDDVVGSRGGFIKGPVVRMVRDLDWLPGGTQAIAQDKPKRCFYAPRAWDIFPSPTAATCNDGTLSERIRMTRADLYSLLGVPGFRDEIVRQVIAEFDTGSVQLSGWYWEDAERQRLETQNLRGTFYALSHGTVDVIEHWTTVPGALLAEWGMPAEMIDDPQRPFSVVAWVCGANRVLGVRINDDPKQERPYFKAGFRAIAGSFWYEGVPAIGRDFERLCNAAARAMSNNAANASGYVTELQVDRLAKNETAKRPAPMTVYQTVQARNGASGPAVFFHQAAMRSDEYMRIFKFWSNELDEALGLPGFLAGINETSGAGGTSSGLAQLREMQATMFGGTTALIDYAIGELVQFTHRDLLLTPDDDPIDNTDPNQPHTLHGETVFRGNGSRSVQERRMLQVRLNELLQSTANPVDISIMGTTGRAELLRAAFEGFDTIDKAKVVPSHAELVTRDMLQAQQAAAMANQLPQPGAPAATDPAGQPVGAGTNMVA